MKEYVKITIEDEKQKAFITITSNGDDTHTVDFTFSPEISLKEKQESMALQMAARFMDFLSNE